jgi:DNA mismatch repair ATPase MutS
LLTDPDMLAAQPDASLLLAVWESPAAPQDAASDVDAHAAIPPSRTVGLCALDAATGTFHLGQFTDDGLRSKLRSALAHLRPVRAAAAAAHRGKGSGVAERPSREKSTPSCGKP